MSWRRPQRHTDAADDVGLTTAFLQHGAERQWLPLDLHVHEFQWGLVTHVTTPVPAKGAAQQGPDDAGHRAGPQSGHPLRGNVLHQPCQHGQHGVEDARRSRLLSSACHSRNPLDLHVAANTTSELNVNSVAFALS